jgi:hypothetical protein
MLPSKWRGEKTNAEIKIEVKRWSKKMAMSVSDTQAKQRFALTVLIRPVIYTDMINSCDIPKLFMNE